MTLVIDGKRVVGMVLAFLDDGMIKVLFQGTREPQVIDPAPYELRSID